MGFRYSIEQKLEIEQAIPAAAPGALELIVTRGEAAASHYVDQVAYSRSLPPISDLKAERDQRLQWALEFSEHFRRQVSREVARVRKGSEPFFGPRQLINLHLSGDFPLWALKAEFARRALDELIKAMREGRTEPLESKDVYRVERDAPFGVHSFKHRQLLILEAAMCWAICVNKGFHEFTIADDGPMVRFVDALVGPALEITGENVSMKMMARLIREAIKPPN